MAKATPSAGDTLMGLFIAELTRRMRDTPQEMKSSDLEVVRKFMTDNSVTLASVKRGDFGEMAQRVAEEFPFEAETPTSIQ